MKWELEFLKIATSELPTLEYSWRTPPPRLQVYYNYKATTDVEGNQTPILFRDQ